MPDLWAGERAKARRAVEPLAARMRPRTLDEFAGQGHILGEGRLLRRMLDADALTSVVFFGPPGTGKTTLAEVIAAHTRRDFVRENAASVGVARIREILERAARALETEGRRTILFLDEIHRFTRAQQDVLLADVERGLVTLIGATTENPLFAINSALVSRSTMFRFEPLSPAEVTALLRRAIEDRERGLGGLDLRVDDDALEVWAIRSDGDARRALTALEVAVLSGGEGGAASGGPIRVTRRTAEDSIQQKLAVYDQAGDEHYDTASAFIKSLRGSDPDAAIYWLARMLEGGEDPRFIARRLAILASEDIGNADPRAMTLAASCWELVERIGMPEARITLAQCVTYLALAPKSNASYTAVEAALGDVREGRTVPVPLHLRDRHAPRAHGSGVHGAGYEYTHDEGVVVPGLGRVGAQAYLGVRSRYYEPGDSGLERVLAERLAAARAVRAGEAGGPAPDAGAARL